MHFVEVLLNPDAPVFAANNQKQGTAAKNQANSYIC